MFLFYSCDADPKVLAQYIIALIGNGERNDALRASLDDKLKEFFDDRKLLVYIYIPQYIYLLFVETAPFIDRLFVKLNSNNKKAPKEPSDRFNAYSDEEDDDGDRNFKHRRQRSEPRDDRTDFSEQNKRRYADENPQYSNKHFRGNNGDDRRNPYNIPSGATGGYSSYDRGRGRAGAGRGYSGPNRAGTKPPMCRDYIGKQLGKIRVLTCFDVFVCRKRILYERRCMSL